MKLLLCVVTLLLPLGATAADPTRESTSDPRIRYVTFKPDDVVVINVRRGVVTRLVLDPNEKITAAGTGFAAACDKDELEWCIRADRDTNQVWIKPRERATHNNLELATTKRDYSIALRVLPDRQAGADGDEMYRVIFQYPVPKIPLPFAGAGAQPIPSASQPRDGAAVLASRLQARPVARNSKYSMEVMKGGALIAPSLAFDDGRFTYFRFPNNREIPAPFLVEADQREARVNFHIDDDLMVVHKVAPRFNLRLGDAVVGIWNEAYDPDGVGTPKGVVVPNVERVNK